MFTLIDILASREESMSLKDISEKAGLHPSTAHRILNDLATGRFVDRTQPGSYRLGMRLLELGNLVKGRLNVRDAAVVPMRELHKLIQQPVNLSVRQGDEIVYVERAYSERSGMQVVRAIGGRAPLHLTSVGKLFLAADDALSDTGLCPRAPVCMGIPKTASPNWSARTGTIQSQPIWSPRNDNEELELGVRCMAAGIYDDQDQACCRAVHFCTCQAVWTKDWLPKLQGNCPNKFRRHWATNQRAQR
jgi:DNA-binding IclR family transcriptional regulator